MNFKEGYPLSFERNRINEKWVEGGLKIGDELHWHSSSYFGVYIFKVTSINEDYVDTVCLGHGRFEVGIPGPRGGDGRFLAFIEPIAHRRLDQERYIGVT